MFLAVWRFEMKTNAPEIQLTPEGTLTFCEQRDPQRDQLVRELQTIRCVRVTIVVVGAALLVDSTTAAAEEELVDVVAGVVVVEGVAVVATAVVVAAAVVVVDVVDVVAAAEVVVVVVVVTGAAELGSALVAVGTKVPASPARMAEYTRESNPFESKTILQKRRN